MKKFLFLFAAVMLAFGACTDDIKDPNDGPVVPEISSVENTAGDADAGVINLVAHWDEALNGKITKVTYVLKDDAGTAVSSGEMTVSSDKAEVEITGLALGSGPYWPTVVPYAGETEGAAFTLPEGSNGLYAGGTAEVPFAFAWIEQNLVAESNGRQVKVTVGWDYEKFTVDYIGYSAWTLDWANNFTGDFTDYDAANGRASVVITLPEGMPYGNYILGLTVTEGDYGTWVPGAGFATDAGCTPPYLMFPEPEPEEPFAFAWIEQNLVAESNGRQVKVTVGWDYNKFNVDYIGYSAFDLGWGNGFTGDFTDYDAANGRASVVITLPEGNPYGNYILGLTVTEGDYNAWVGGLGTDGATPPFLEFPEPEEPFAFAWIEQNLVAESNGRQVKVTVGWDYNKFNVDYIGYSAWTLDWANNFTGDFTDYDAANGRASVVITLPEGMPYGNYILGLTVTQGDYGTWVPGAGFATDAGCTPPYLMFPEPEKPAEPFAFTSIEQNLVAESNGRKVEVTVSWDSNKFNNVDYIGYSAWTLDWSVNFTGDFTDYDAAAGRASVVIELPEGKPYGNYILGLTVTQGDYNAWIGGLATDGATPPFLQFPEPEKPAEPFAFTSVEQNLVADSNGRKVEVTVFWDSTKFTVDYIGYSAWTLDWVNNFTGDFTDYDAAAGRASVVIELPEGKPYGNYILGLTVTQGDYNAWVGGLATDGATPPFLQFPDPAN